VPLSIRPKWTISLLDDDDGGIVSYADANGDEDGEGRHEEVSDSKNVNKQTLVF
jgi:hypothetical protein